MRVNFEFDAISVGIGMTLAWFTVRIRKIFRLWKIKEDSAQGLTIHNGEYRRVVNTLETLLGTDREILKGQASLAAKVDGIDGRVCKIESVLPRLAKGN